MQEVSCRPRDKRGPGCCPCESAGPRPFAAGSFLPTSFCSSLQDASAPRAQGGFLALMCPVLIQGLALPLLSLTCVSRSCADRGHMLVSTKRRLALQPLLGTGDVRAGDSHTVSTELRALRPGPASRGRGGADPASFPWSRCTRRARTRPRRHPGPRSPGSPRCALQAGTYRLRGGIAMPGHRLIAQPRLLRALSGDARTHRRPRHGTGAWGPFCPGWGSVTSRGCVCTVHALAKGWRPARRLGGASLHPGSAQAPTTPAPGHLGPRPPRPPATSAMSSVALDCVGAICKSDTMTKPFKSNNA